MKISNLLLLIFLLGTATQSTHALHTNQKLTIMKNWIQNRFEKLPISDQFFLFAVASAGAFFSASFILPNKHAELLRLIAGSSAIATSAIAYDAIGK